MISLSFSTINNCLQPNNSHNWLNKQMGRKIPETDPMKIGKELHKIIQARVLTGTWSELSGFHVETKDFDEKMKVSKKIDKKYEIFGYVDGKREDAILEIKTATNFWPITQFYNSNQLGMYALMTGCKIIFCMTAISDMGTWVVRPPRIYEIIVTDRLIENGRKFVQKAIELLEKGEFTGGLTDGKCLDYCTYGQNCYFK